MKRSSWWSQTAIGRRCALLEDVVEREPENYEAWLGLRQAAVTVAPRLSREATREALALNPLARRDGRER